MRKISLAPYLLILLLLAICALWIFESKADANPRYRFITGQYSWSDSQELPFSIIGPMCWNSRDGFCDAGVQAPARRVGYLIDFANSLHGIILQNDSGCWLWWFEPAIDADGTPHIHQADWIVCNA